MGNKAFPNLPLFTNPSRSNHSNPHTFQGHATTSKRKTSTADVMMWRFFGFASGVDRGVIALGRTDVKGFPVSLRLLVATKSNNAAIHAALKANPKSGTSSRQPSNILPC